MAFTTPYTFTALELLTAAKMNAIQANITAIWVGTTAGDMDYYTSATAKTRLAIGTAGKILMSTGSAPSWETGTRWIPTQLNSDLALSTGDGQGRFVIPSDFNGWNITNVAAVCDGGTGVPAFQLRNVTDSVDVLSTKVTIDSGEVSSYTAATPPVIDTTKDDVATGDRFAWDVDVAGTSRTFVFCLVGLTKP